MAYYSAFVAANSGYTSETNKINDLNQANSHVFNIFNKHGPEEFSCVPSLVVWSTDRGCPKGGSPCSLITFQEETCTAARISFMATKDELGLSTILITGNDKNLGDRCTIFEMETSGISLGMAAELWQDAMQIQLDKTGIETSAGLWHLKGNNSRVYIQSVCNPTKFDTDEKKKKFKKNLYEIIKVFGNDMLLTETQTHCLYLNKQPALHLETLS